MRERVSWIEAKLGKDINNCGKGADRHEHENGEPDMLSSRGRNRLPAVSPSDELFEIRRPA
jgi:hypothetical protein